MLLRTILDSIADSVVVVTSDGVVRYMNPAAEALFQRGSGELVGSVFAYPLDNGEMVIARGPGDDIPVELRASPCEWEGQDAKVAVLRDISDRKRLCSMIRAVHTADRRAAVAQLSSSVAHEINNPAAFMLTNLTVMHDILDDFEALFKEARITRALREKYQITQSLSDMRDMLKDNRMGVDRIRAFVRELKCLSQPAGEQVEMVDLNEAVAVAVAITRGALRRSDKLVCSLGELPLIAADRIRIMQILVNLLDNAVRALAAGESQYGRIEVSTAVRGDHVCIAIRDNGIGIPEEHVSRIFDPLFVAEPGTGSIGLGLPTCAEIASHHRGRILVDSKRGLGSRFVLELPRDTGLPLTNQQTAAVGPGHVRARVLLVEDEPHMRRRIRNMIESSHDVIDAGGTRRVLDHVATDSDYDVVLFDAVTATQGVEEVYRNLVKHAPNLGARMVLIGDSTMPADVRRFVRACRLMVMETPLSRSLLCEVIERMSA